MKNVLVYVAGPISRGCIVANVRQAHEAGMALLKAGIPCIVPHGSCFWGSVVQPALPLTPPWFVPEVLPAGSTHIDWYGMDLVIVSRCDAVLRLPGESVGADLEVRKAEELGLPVFETVEGVISWARIRAEGGWYHDVERPPEGL